MNVDIISPDFDSALRPGCPMNFFLNCGFSINKTFRALRTHLLFQLLIVALSVSIFSLYSIKQKHKKFADFIIFS